MPKSKVFIVPREPARRQPELGMPKNPNNLPVQSTPLIGRETEVDALSSMLRRTDVRLLILTGPPGIGKTRLGIQVAANLLDDFPDGIYFVPLAPIGDPELVIPTIAQAVGVKEMAGQPLVQSLQSFLKDKNALLLLDNFEQVARAAPLLSELLADSPGVKMLITSRELLHLYGEHDYPVPPLSLPQPGKPPDLDALSRYEAVALFVQRAQAVSPGFELTDHNAHAIVEICLRLDGLPLAIELAAARILVLPPEELLARLKNRLILLTGGARNLPERQRTLRATLDWSYNLLDAAEQTLFRKLGVFVGGCTLEAIEEVCGSELGMYTLDGVTSLVGKSLLQRQEGVAGEPRFMMLETIREYAREKLEESGEGNTIRHRHADFLVEFVERAAPELWGRRQGEWLDRIEQELGNLRAAMEWSLAYGSVETAAWIAAPLYRFWFIHGRMSEGLRWLEQMLDARHMLPTPARTKVLEAAGTLAGFQRDYERADELLSECLNLCRQSGDLTGVADALNHLGLAANTHGDEERAIALWEESLALRRQLGHRSGVAQSLMNLGDALSIKADYARAEAMLEESRALWEELGDEIGLALTLSGMASNASRRSEYAKAETLAKKALLLFHSLGSEVHTIGVLDLLADTWVEQGNAEGALRLQAAIEALSEVDKQLQSDATATRPGHERSVSAARAQIDDGTFAKLWSEGQAMSLEEAMAYALEPIADGIIETEKASASPESQEAYPNDLTEREVEVLRLIAAGRSNQEIAQELVLSTRTVERHISNIYQKIGATGRVARATATAYVLRQGLTT
jgi:predicted ATPase/DNA-binding NarL/FixJ family response regulator